jgi:hypothetical protein
MTLHKWYPGYGATSADDRANYAGKDLSAFVAVVSQNRDSDSLDKSNFRVALMRLGGESATVQVHRFDHWACGWVENLLIDPTNATAVLEAARIAADMERYPVLDDDDHARTILGDHADCSGCEECA